MIVKERERDVSDASSEGLNVDDADFTVENDEDSDAVVVVGSLKLSE